MSSLRELLTHPTQDGDCRGHWVALVGGVVRENNPLVLVDEDGLDGCRASVNSQPAPPVSLRDRKGRNFVEGVAVLELRPFLIVCEEGPHPRGLRNDMGRCEAVDKRDQLLCRLRLGCGILRRERGTHGDVELGVIRGHEPLCAGEQALIRCAKLRKEV